MFDDNAMTFPKSQPTPFLGLSALSVPCTIASLRPSIKFHFLLPKSLSRGVHSTGFRYRETHYGISTTMLSCLKIGKLDTE
jgi:hypothetical protein